MRELCCLRGVFPGEDLGWVLQSYARVAEEREMLIHRVECFQCLVMLAKSLLKIVIYPFLCTPKLNSWAGEPAVGKVKLRKGTGKGPPGCMVPMWVSLPRAQQDLGLSPFAAISRWPGVLCPISLQTPWMGLQGPSGRFGKENICLPDPV